MVSYIVRGARSGEVQVALVPAIPGYNEGRKLSQRVSQRLWITAEWLSQSRVLAPRSIPSETVAYLVSLGLLPLT